MKLYKTNNGTYYKQIHYTMEKKRNTYFVSIPRIVIIMVNQSVPCLYKFASKGNVIQQRKTVVLRFMLFQTLSCEDGAYTSIRPSKVLSFLEKRSRDVLRSPLPVGTRRSLAVVVDQPSLQSSRILPLIVAYNGAALP